MRSGSYWSFLDLTGGLLRRWNRSISNNPTQSSHYYNKATNWLVGCLWDMHIRVCTIASRPIANICAIPRCMYLSVVIFMSPFFLSLSCSLPNWVSIWLLCPGIQPGWLNAQVRNKMLSIMRRPWLQVSVLLSVTLSMCDVLETDCRTSFYHQNNLTN